MTTTNKPQTSTSKTPQDNRQTAQDMVQRDKVKPTPTNPTNAGSPKRSDSVPPNHPAGYSNPDSPDEGDAETNLLSADTRTAPTLSPKPDGGDGDDGLKPVVEDPKMAQQFVV